MKHRKQLRLDAFRDRLETELLSVGFPVPLLNILLPLIGPLLLTLLEKCVNKHNPQRLRALATMLHRGGFGVTRDRSRLEAHIAALPISLDAKQMDQFIAALCKVGSETPTEEYHAVAAEVEFTKGSE